MGIPLGGRVGIIAIISSLAGLVLVYFVVRYFYRDYKRELAVLREEAGGRGRGPPDPASAPPLFTGETGGGGGGVESGDIFLDAMEKEEIGLQEGEGARCAICFDKPKTHAFNPCGHVFCAECASKISRARKTCPLCNKAVHSVLRLYQ